MNFGNKQDEKRAAIVLDNYLKRCYEDMPDLNPDTAGMQSAYWSPVSAAGYGRKAGAV